MKSKVSIATGVEIGAAIENALGFLEGLDGLFRNRHVAIKPNETWASPEDLTACTQADTVRSVIRHVKAFSPAKVTVTGGAGAGETDQIFGYLGIDKVIKEEGVEFIDHNRPPFKKVKLDHGPHEEIVVNEKVLEYEVLVSLAQHKVHSLAAVTLTMKNIALSYPAADYYGHPRSSYLHPHRLFSDLHGLIAGVCKRFPISLGIINGHPAMVGKGPVGGQTFDSGMVIASRDFVAADSIGAKLLGVERVAHIEMGQILGLGKADFNEIEVVGLTFSAAKKLFDERRKRAA